MIGIYHGYDKPKSANNVLEEFVNDIIAIINEGFTFNNKRYSVKIYSFVCDAPAKAFITYCKGHSGYKSCTKCYIEGEYINGRICFPTYNNVRLRTDAEFRAKLQEGHHTDTSILEKIPHLIDR